MMGRFDGSSIPSRSLPTIRAADTRRTMASPAVSVIIPTFNRAGSIEAAVQSALEQTYSDIEVIVVDDGSTDATMAVLSSIGDPRLRTHVQAKNAGAAAARNVGLRAARGRLIAFLDSDDVWFPEKLTRQVALLDAAPPGRDVCCTGVMLHLLDHGVTRERRVEDSANWAHTIAIGCDLSPGSTLVAKREAFDRVGLLDETLPRFEDWDWMFRYTRAGDIIVISEPLAHVYNRRGRLGDQVELSTRRFLAKHDQALRQLPQTVRATAITDAWLQVVAAYGFEHRFGDAIAPFFRAFRVQPVKCILRAFRGAFYVARGRFLRQADSA